MPQIDVYIFRFFPFFIFFVFVLVYIYIYFSMLPNVVGVLKFRIKYNVTLNNDLINLKKSELKSQFFLVTLYSFCNQLAELLNTSIKKSYTTQFCPVEDSKVNALFKFIKL